MPKRITPPQSEETVRVILAMRRVDYDALAALAAESYRTPELQCAYLIARILADSGRTSTNGQPSPTGHVGRILDHARAKASDADK